MSLKTLSHHTTLHTYRIIVDVTVHSQVLFVCPWKYVLEFRMLLLKRLDCISYSGGEGRVTMELDWD